VVGVIHTGDMAIDLPSLESLRHILDRLKANDISWFKDQFAQGKFSWLKDRLPSGEYETIETRVQAGDLSPLKGALSKIDLPGMDLFKGLGGAALGAAGAGVAGAAAMAGNVGGKVGAGVSGATGAVSGLNDNKKSKGWLWILPAIVAIALLAWLLRGCGSDEVVDDGGEVAEEVVEETIAEEVVAEEPVVEETVPAETVVETTVAAEVATTVAAAVEAPAGDILAVAGAAGSFKTLAAAVSAAGLTETLQGAGPFTVFAPTDDAFAALPAGVVDALLKPENKEALAKVLTYHVVAGKVMAADVVAGPVKTVEGSEFVITTEGGVKIGDANVTATDIAASNGVIHVIDKVLVPGSVDVAALLAGAAPAAEPAAVATPENLTVYFGNASSIVDDAAQDKLDGAIAVLKALPAGSKVKIVGHASAKGNAAKNEALSIERAENVKGQLIAGLGDAASNVTFTVDAVGASQSEADEAKSRKVTIEIQP
jgi:uncharacterized surface protein with fasciclin (FAS1) repeats